MRLVIDIFDHRAASAARRASGAFISQSAVAGHDLTSLDTFTGLPFELEQQVLSKCYPEHQHQRRLRLPVSIWDDLSKPETFAAGETAPIVAANDRVKQLNAHAAPFTPNQRSRGQPQPAGGARSVSETIQPVFAPLRTLDWRFGPIHIDYLEGPIEYTPPSSLLSPKAPKAAMLELPAIFESRERAKTLELSGEDRKGRPVPSSAGTLDLGYGIIHLYKDEIDKQGSKSDEKALAALDRNTAEQENDGTMVAVLAVPANWPTADFLEFVSEVVPDIEQMRIMRDALPNRYMVLIKFRTSAQASSFQSSYDGKPFSEMLLDESCHVVRISAVEIRTSSTAPYTFAFPQSLEGSGDSVSKKEKGLNELPTCPVCLERMDSSVSGLVTVQCSHTFHCMCLKGWANNNCPVCRYSQGRTKGDHEWGDTLPDSCAVCAATTSLWMCLICGHVGCGRFSGRHAADHFEETGHTFAFELETQRVWDYAGDQYVHRLIQSKTDGKLVELPSSSANALGVKPKAGPHGDAYDDIAKIEAISIEFSDLLGSQLDLQRRVFADKVTKLKQDLSKAEAKRDEAVSEAKGFSKQIQDLRKKQAESQSLREIEESTLKLRMQKLEESVIPNLEKERLRTEKKLEKATELARTLLSDLQSERSLTKGLMDNISNLKDENEKRKAESDTLQSQVKDLTEQLQDVMFTLSAQAHIAEQGGAGGDLVVRPEQTAAKPTSRRKH